MMSASSQFIEPCRSDKWTVGDLRLFLSHYSSSAHILEAFRFIKMHLCLFVIVGSHLLSSLIFFCRHQAVWDRYVEVIKSCILKMYHD